MSRQQLATGDIIEGYDEIKTLVVDQGTGTATLQVETLSTYKDIKTYTGVVSELLPLQMGINYKIVLTGNAVAFLSENR